MGTHPIFESDFDCLTDLEWVDREVDLVVRKETRKSLTEIEIATVNENVPKIENDPDRLDVIGIVILAVIGHRDDHQEGIDRLNELSKKSNKKLRLLPKRLLGKLSFYYEKTLCPKQPITFCNFVPIKKDLGIKTRFFTELFRVSCVKVAILPITMAPVVNQFMAQNLTMKISNSNIRGLVSSQWLIRAKIRMVLNSSSVPQKLIGWTQSTLFSATF